MREAAGLLHGFGARAPAVVEAVRLGQRSGLMAPLTAGTGHHNVTIPPPPFPAIEDVSSETEA